MGLYYDLSKIKYYESRGLAYKAIGENEKAIVDFTLGKMRIYKDDFEGITWYRDRSSPQQNDANGFFLYIVKKGNGLPKLRLKVQYYGSNWLFIDSFTVKVDEKKYKINGKFKRDHDTEIWEWYDTSLNTKKMKMIKTIIASKEAKIRFYGHQYYNDRPITNEHKKALQNVLDAFEVLGGHF